MRDRRKFEVLPFWTDYEGVDILPTYEQDYGNPDDKYFLRRAMVMVSHPWYMTYIKT